MGQAGWVAKMTNFKALTGGKEPWRAPPTHPKTPAKVTCPSLCFLPQVTNIILHCKADEQAGSRKEGFLLQSGFCFLFLPSHRTGKEMFQQTASRGTALSLLPSQAQSPEHHLSFVTCLEKMCCFHVCTFPHRLQMRPEMSLNTDILSKETEKQVVCRFRRAPPFAPVDDWLPVCHWNPYRVFLVVEPAADIMLVFAEPTIKKRVKKWAIPSDRRGGPACLFFLLTWVYTFYKQWENPTRSPLCEVLDILHTVASGTFHTIFCSWIQSVLSFNPF